MGVRGILEKKYFCYIISTGFICILFFAILICVNVNKIVTTESRNKTNSICAQFACNIETKINHIENAADAFNRDKGQKMNYTSIYKKMSYMMMSDINIYAVSYFDGENIHTVGKKDTLFKNMLTDEELEGLRAGEKKKYMIMKDETSPHGSDSELVYVVVDGDTVLYVTVWIDNLIKMSENSERLKNAEIILTDGSNFFSLKNEGAFSSKKRKSVCESRYKLKNQKLEVVCYVPVRSNKIVMIWGIYTLIILVIALGVCMYRVNRYLKGKFDEIKNIEDKIQAYTEEKRGGTDV